MKSRGFTLIELLVVIGIIGLLSTIVVATLSNVRENARLTGAKHAASTLDHDLGSEAVAWFDFNECSGTTARDSAAGISYSLVGSPAWSTDTPMGTGCSLSFDGVSDKYISVPNNSSIDPSGPVSVAVWIKTSSAERQYIIAKGDGNDYVNNYQIFIDTAVYFSIGKGASATYAWKNMVIGDGKWHHIAGTFDGTTAKLYVDGNLMATDTFSGTRQSGGSLWIGKRNNMPTLVNGLVDGVRVYTASLTASGVQKLYTEGRTEHEDELAINK